MCGLVFAIITFPCLCSAICPNLVRRWDGYCKCSDTWDSPVCHSSGATCDQLYLDRNSIVCLSSCGGKLYRVQGSRLCVEKCPAGYYGDMDAARLCLNCNPLCDGCYGPSERECANCKPKYLAFNNSCLFKCPNGYIEDRKTRTATCIRPEACPDFVVNDSCLATCPPGYYYPGKKSSLGTKVCSQCYPDCETCSGPSSSDCITCKTYEYLNRCFPVCPKEAPLILNRECFSTCPKQKNCRTVCGDKYLFNGDCIEACPPSRPFVEHGVCVEACPKLIHGNKCVDTCPGDTYQKGQECVENCPKELFVEGSMCVERCSAFYYGRTCKKSCPGRMANLAGKCQLGCPTSLPVINPVNRTCMPTCTYVIFQHQCLENCPSDYYKTQNNKTCSACDPVCKGCFGPGADRCKACRHFNNSGLCVAKCPDEARYHKDGDQTCLTKCPHDTGHVQGETFCRTDCPANQAMILDGLCVSECPANQNLIIYQKKQCLKACPPMTILGAGTNSCFPCPEEHVKRTYSEGTVIKGDDCVSKKCPFGIALVDTFEDIMCVVFFWGVLLAVCLGLLLIYKKLFKPSNAMHHVQEENENLEAVGNADDPAEVFLDMADDTKLILPTRADTARMLGQENGVVDLETTNTAGGVNRASESGAVNTGSPAGIEAADPPHMWNSANVEGEITRFQSGSTMSSAEYPDVTHGTLDVAVHEVPLRNGTTPGQSQMNSNGPICASMTSNNSERIQPDLSEAVSSKKMSWPAQTTHVDTTATSINWDNPMIYNNNDIIGLVEMLPSVPDLESQNNVNDDEETLLKCVQ